MTSQAQNLSFVCCPKCQGKLNYDKSAKCSKCSLVYPLVSGVPLLIDEENSVFSHSGIKSEWKQDKKTSNTLIYRTALFFYKYYPSIYNKRRHLNITKKFLAEIKKINKKKITVLCVGSGYGSIAYKELKKLDNVSVIDTDVYLNERRHFVSDIHSLPVDSSSVDVVLIEGVLEHVLDPTQAVAEIWRVLKKDGLLLCTVPFVLGVHTAVADYQRFTRLGLIRLLKRFQMKECEPIEGIYTALAYHLSFSYMTSASSIFPGRSSVVATQFAKYSANLLLFWLKYLDLLTRRNPISKDCAMNYYYIGNKSQNIMSDKQINKLFNGKGICPL